MPGKKILIVEDDEAINNMYQIKLKQEGYEVLGAYNGSDGLDMAKKEKPDLILLDVILPRLDGFTVLEELKRDKDTAKITVVMLTNLSTSEDQAKAKQFGADGYFVKARLTPTEVGATVTKFLTTIKE